MADTPNRSSLLLPLAGLALLLSGALAGWAYEHNRLADGQFEKRVHDYLVNNPEVLAEAAENYGKQANEKQIAALADKIEQPFPGAVLGNPNGTVIMVEFTDFACTYCRASVAEVEDLIKANPDLKVVIRELPIIAPTPDAARWGLAAAKQGKYPAFHKAMFAAGRTDMASIEAAARVAGLDLDAARAYVASKDVDAELAANLGYAKQLRIDGTPSWLIGDQLIQGAVGKADLSRALDAARKTQ